MRHWKRHFTFTLFSILATVAGNAATSLEYVDEGVRELLALPDTVEAEWVDLKVNLSPEETGIKSIRALGPALDQVLVEVQFDEVPHFALADLVLLVDVDGNKETGERLQGRDGVEAYVRVVNQTSSPRFVGALAEAEASARILQDEDRVYFMIQSPWIEGVPNPSNVRVYGRYARSRPDAQRAIFVCSPGKLKRADRRGGALPEFRSVMVKPPTAYRFWTDNAKARGDEREFTGRILGTAYEKQSFKGVTREMVEVENPGEFGRERPLPTFRNEYTVAGKGNSEGSVRVEILEEYGVDRPNAHLTFGVPFGEGELLSNEGLKLKTVDGVELPASFPVTVTWPDGSIKWVLVDTQLDIAANESVELEVTWGESGSAPKHTDWWKQEKGAFIVNTGPLQARLSTEAFRFLEDLVVDGNIKQGGLSFPRGLVLVDEQGEEFSSALGKPDRIDVELATNDRLVIRYEGGYYNAEGKRYHKYVARVGFYRGSSKVDLSVRHINDWLEYEFSDIQSLALPAQVASPVEGVDFALDGEEVVSTSGELYYFQQDANVAILNTDGGESQAGRVPGAFVVSGKSGTWGAVLENCWQRWPKGLEVKGDFVDIYLLPFQPEGYGSGLPAHLLFPFAEGFYRLKWGVAFTERMHFDFSPKVKIFALAAEGQSPLIAVLPAERYAETKAFGDVATGQDELAQRWDAFFEQSYLAHEARRERQQEYGFLNFGDWFGERGRNWGNNEYDTAHGFFSQFARTGDRRYFRTALAAARHQADVDIVHAYPNPYHVGAMHIHSVGHNGPSSHIPSHGVWSYAYNMGVQAGNGHTWAEGMAEDWYLTGDPFVMDSMLELGEHIAWFMAPRFEMNPESPRGAGWSLRSAVAIYRATSDPIYLQAAETIALKAREKQDPSGAWVRERPQDRAQADSDSSSAVTNFQMGVLLGGLKEYHRLTKDPRVEEAMIRGAEFMRRTWENTGGWPYWISTEAQAHAGRSEILYGVYPYTADGIVYIGRELVKDPFYGTIARQAMVDFLNNHEISATGQKIGFTLRGGNSLLVEIDAFSEKEN